MINIIFTIGVLISVAELLLIIHGLSGCRVKIFLVLSILLLAAAIILTYRYMRVNNVKLRPLMSWGGLSGRIPYDDDPNDSTVTGLGWV